VSYVTEHINLNNEFELKDDNCKPFDEGSIFSEVQQTIFKVDPEEWDFE
jgi:hypothetical protein